MMDQKHLCGRLVVLFRQVKSMNKAALPSAKSLLKNINKRRYDGVARYDICRVCLECLVMPVVTPVEAHVQRVFRCLK